MIMVVVEQKIYDGLFIPLADILILKLGILVMDIMGVKLNLLESSLKRVINLTMTSMII